MTGGQLTGRTAIVTGASRGIGLAAASALHDAGADVVVTSRSQEAAAEAAAQVGERAVGIQAHATDESAARACVEQVMQRTGRIDVLVNNVGTNPAHGPLMDQEHSRFAKTIDVNVWAPLLWSQLVVGAWMGRHGGAIINTASIGGLQNGTGIGVYDVSKAAVVHLTRQLAIELGPQVRVNAVAPGLVRTRMAEALWKGHEDQVGARTPLGRIGDPPDIAEVFVFLASDAARWITGETVVVDGGLMINARAAAEAAQDEPVIP